MAGGTVSGTYSFRGMDYVVTMTTEAGSSLMVEVEDKLSADQWRATFDAAYLEDLTRKTGNYKQFQIFISMLESAIIQSSESVSLDLLTYSDLESLRTRKTGDVFQNAPRAPKNATLNSKRYLILTYTVEFDRIHYPLPLPYVGKPDPRKLQETIRHLQAEIKTLRQKGTKDVRHKELDKLKRDYDKLLQEKEDIEAAFVEFQREVKHTSVGSAAKEIRVLKDIVKNLEEDMLTERTSHQRAATRRSHEHRQALTELDEVKTSERNLRARVKSLTNELAVYKRRGGSRTNNTSASSTRGRHSHQNSALSNGYSSRENSFSRDNSRLSRFSTNNSYSSKNRSLERSRERSLSRDRSRSRDKPLYLRDRSSSRERSLSRDRGPTRDRSRINTSGGSASSNRSRGASPSGIMYPRFDPTAYIKDKRKKEKEKDRKMKRPSSKLSGSYDRKPRSSLNDGSVGRLPRSRNSSVGSLRSRTSSLESLSDVGLASDTSDGRLRKTRQILKTAKALNAWSSPDVSFSGKPSRKPPTKTTKAKKVLSSTPENQRTKSKTREKENLVTSDAGGDSDYFDRSTEIGEIDARLNRLQQFMKQNL